jgi:biopolymer transport protein TolR
MNDADKEDAILIAITRDGKTYLGADQVDPAQITTLVQDKLAKKTGDKRAYVKADAHAKYGVVVDVVDDVRSAGVDELGLLTEQKKTTPPPGEEKKNPNPSTP